MDNKKRFKLGKRGISLIVVGVSVAAAFVLFQNIGAVAAAVGRGFSLLAPFLWGIALAYLLSLLLRFLERTVLKKIKRPKLRRALGVVLTLGVAAAFLTGMLFAIIPQLISSAGRLIENISPYIDRSESIVMGWAASLGISEATVHSLIGNWEEVLIKLAEWAKDLLPEILDTGVRVGSGIFRFLVSVVVAIYVLVDIDRLLRQVRMVSLALLGEKVYRRLDDIRLKCHKAFGGFLVGKSLDSLIIGLLCFIVMLIFGWPYPLLISVIIGVTNVIPTFGPFLGAIPSIFIIFIVEPVEAFWFAIFILILQQLDGNVIGPHILGDSLGLSALWILFSVVLFGSMWGVVGMVVGVPLFAVVYDLLGEWVLRRLLKKKADSEPILSEQGSADGGNPADSE